MGGVGGGNSKETEAKKEFPRPMGEVTHTTVLNKISDDEERKIAIM